MMPTPAQLLEAVRIADQEFSSAVSQAVASQDRLNQRQSELNDAIREKNLADDENNSKRSDATEKGKALLSAIAAAGLGSGQFDATFADRLNASATKIEDAIAG